MLEGFAHVWSAVAMADELGKAKPLGLTVAGTPVVLFRDAEGKARALVDRCPHRGVALSLGTVQGGKLRCPFHGWEFEGGGHVCHVPWNPDAKLTHLRGTPLPLRELGGQLWLYTAPVETPPSEPEVHESLLDPKVRVSGMRVVWNTHWTRAMENMLDWPHLPFIHANTIGRGMTARAASQRMDVEWEDRPWGAHTYVRIDGQVEPGTLDFRWPNAMNLHIPIPGKRMLMMVSCVPIDGGRTAMLLAMARDFFTARMFDGLFHRTNLKIATEDKAVVESSYPVEVPPAGDERSVRTDGPTLAFRKRYYQELRGSSAAEGAAALPAGARRLALAAG